jgi:hypothetical protein
MVTLVGLLMLPMCDVHPLTWRRQPVCLEAMETFCVSFLDNKQLPSQNVQLYRA